LLFGGLVFVPRLLNYSLKSLFVRLAPILLSGGIMLLFVVMLKPFLSFILLIPIGAVFYISSLFITRAVKKDDFLQVTKLFRRVPVNPDTTL